ncbi:MAG: hypothetical protein ABWY06_22345 [Pseudomonas sp.]|uniref:hypothetical protein n=1 Tax=Pseudomonas sp. TaxID=306 RepID=UPI0033982D46
MVIRSVLFSLATLLLCACSPSVGTPAYIAPEPGLIGNPRFESKANKPNKIAEPWLTSQHAGVPSYEFSSLDGVLSIKRVDEQVWAHLAQRIDVSQLHGQTLEFSVELSGTLDQSHGEPLGPTGLGLTLRGKTPDQPRSMPNRAILFNQSSEPGMSVGAQDWQRQSLRFKVPTTEEARDVEAELYIVMTLGGELKARGPSLQVVETD